MFYLFLQVTGTKRSADQFSCWRLGQSRRGRRQLQVCNSAQEVVGVLLFSALPFTAVQTLADSKLGKSLRASLLSMPFTVSDLQFEEF